MADVVLGKDLITNKEIAIEQGHRSMGMLVLGSTGSGKSTLIEQLCIQDIKDGYGCCVIEPSGKLINNILVRIPPEREKDVILLYPEDEEAAFGLNIYECPDLNSPRMVAYTLNNVMDTFEKLYDMSRSTPRMAQVMRNVALTLIYNPGMTLIDVLPLLEEKAFRERLLHRAQPEQVRFWQRYDRMNFSQQWDLTESTQNKMDEFVNDPLLKYIFGQSKTINFREVMDNKKLLFIHLSAEMPAMTDLLGCICIGQILAAAVTRDPNKKYPQFNLYIDELQRFLTPALNTLLTESRKYSIATCAAHQVRDQLNDVQKATTLQARSLVVFLITSKDAEELAGEFDTTPPLADEREKTIPSDILMHLSDHPNTIVKDFERRFTRKFLQAKALKTREESYKAPSPGGGIYEDVTRYDTVYPEFPFDDEPIKFDPNDLLAFLESLEAMLFDVMHHQGKTLDQFNDVLMKWGNCCSGILYPTKRGLRNNLDKTGKRAFPNS